jgi:serine/threonine protein kinase
MISDLLVRMLKKNADERITIEEISQHPWIRNSVWAIYFQKGFQAWLLAKEDDPDIVAGLKKFGIAPGDIPDGSSEAIVRRILIRRKQVRMAAQPELFGSGGAQRYGFSGSDLPSHGGLSSQGRAIPALGDPTHRLSLLENVQHHTGVVLAKRVSGRVAIRSPHRTSPLYLASGSSGMLTLPSPSSLPAVPQEPEEGD